MILDGCVVIGALDEQDAHHHAAVDILVKAGDNPLRIPEVTLAEVLVAYARAGTAKRALAVLEGLGVTRVAVADCALDLAQLRAQTSLKMPDCIVLFAAERACEPLATFDARLAAAARERIIEVIDSA